MGRCLSVVWKYDLWTVHVAVYALVSFLSALPESPSRSLTVPRAPHRPILAEVHHRGQEKAWAALAIWHYSLHKCIVYLPTINTLGRHKYSAAVACHLNSLKRASRSRQLRLITVHGDNLGSRPKKILLMVVVVVVEKKYSLINTCRK